VRYALLLIVVSGLLVYLLTTHMYFNKT